MATRRPLVLNGGNVEECSTGDTLYHPGPTRVDGRLTLFEQIYSQYATTGFGGPILVASSEMCSGLTANYLGAITQDSAYHRNRANHTGSQAASTIIVTPSGNLSATTAAAALDELQGDIDTLARGICDGRLTLESGVAVSSSDQTAKSTLYFTPHNGSRIGLYNGTRWTLHAFTERSLALSGLTSGKNYDVFIYDNAGTLTLELSAAWTNDTTRANALALQDGVYVKSGATTRRWLGMIRTTGTNTTEDSTRRRFLFNQYNQVRRMCGLVYTTSHSYNSLTIRQWNAAAANQIEFILPETRVLAVTLQAIIAGTSAGVTAYSFLGLDNTAGANVSFYAPNSLEVSAASVRGIAAGLGYHFISANQAVGGGSATYLGVVVETLLDI